MSTLYAKIADDLAQDIQQGQYAPGTKVPSVRHLSKLRGVSISTVNQAYALLEDRGFIRSKPQSGYFVREGVCDPILAPPMSAGTEPGIVGKSELISRMLSVVNTNSHINLGAAIPHLSFMPQRALQTHIQKVSRFQSQEALNYQFSPGLESLRKQIAVRMRAVGVRIHSDEVVITNGCSEALSLCLCSNTKPGDIVAVESPCYYGFLQLAKQFELKIIEIPTDPQSGISLEALDLALSQWPIKIVAVNSRYSNPTGAAFSSTKQHALFELAKRHDVKILEDDIYGEIGFEDSIQSVIKKFDSDGRVMYCSSYSKTVSPGLRVGWCIPGNSLQTVKKLQTFTTFGPATLSQLTMSSFLQTGHYDKHLRNLTHLCRDNIERITQAVHQYFPKGTKISQPKGGYILWVCLPFEVSAMDLQLKSLKEGINIAPGGLFSNSEHFNHYIRLNCALPWSEELRAAIKKLGTLI
jgi:DNA-binding transcriptional MocR family regulator